MKPIENENGIDKYTYMNKVEFCKGSNGLFWSPNLTAEDLATLDEEWSS